MNNNEILSPETVEAGSAGNADAGLQSARRNMASKLKKAIAAGAAVLGTLAAGNAEAQESKRECSFSIEGKDQSEITVKKGEKVDAGFITASEPKFMIMPSDGWQINGFEKGQCAIGDRNKCGRVTASKIVTGPEKVTFAVVGGDCEGATKEVQINIAEEAPEPAAEDLYEPNEVKWTQDEKEQALEPHERWYDLAAGVQGYHNYSDTTSVGVGPEVQFNARPGTKHFTIGALARYTHDRQPVWEELKPQNTIDRSREALTFALRFAGVATGDWGGADHDWFQLSGGVEAGVTVMLTGSEDIGDDRIVESDTYITPIIGPTVKLTLSPWEQVGFYGGFDLPIELVPRPTDAGTDGRNDAPDSVIHTKPTFSGGLQANF